MRFESRNEMLFASRYAALLDEQQRFGYFLGSWVFSGEEDDASRAEKARSEIMLRNKVNANETIKHVVGKMLSVLDDSAWRWYDWATKQAIAYINQEMQAVENGQKSSEQYMRDLPGLMENLVTQVNRASAIQQKTQAQENWSQWTPEQLQEWVQKNWQGDKLQGSKFVKNNVVYTYKNGWTIVKLEDPKDYKMVGEELGNCTRHEAPNGWRNHPGIFALVDPEGNPKAVARFGGEYVNGNSVSPGPPELMNICYEFQSFNQEYKEQEPAYEYADYLFEFLDKTTPEEFGFDFEGASEWVNDSEVQKPHEIVWEYNQGNRDFTNRALVKADLQGADLRGAIFQGAILRESDLRFTDLEGADLREANLDGADLRGADLRGAIFQGANLQGADLRGAILRKANLEGAVFWRANLRKANLEGADLDGADLRGADLREAILRKANLEGANLWAADLREADLRETNLEGANLGVAIFRGIIWDVRTKWPDDRPPSSVNTEPQRFI